MIKESSRISGYLGFETLPDGGRRFDFSITATGQASTRVTLRYSCFGVCWRKSHQLSGSAKICLEKLRFILASESGTSALPQIPVTYDDIARFRPVKRGQTRAKAAAE